MSKSFYRTSALPPRLYWLSRVRVFLFGSVRERSSFLSPPMRVKRCASASRFPPFFLHLDRWAAEESTIPILGRLPLQAPMPGCSASWILSPAAPSLWAKVFFPVLETVCLVTRSFGRGYFRLPFSPSERPATRFVPGEAQDSSFFSEAFPRTKFSIQLRFFRPFFPERGLY